MAFQQDKNLLPQEQLNKIVIGTRGNTEMVVGNYKFNIDQTVGVGQDGWVLKYNHSTGQLELAAP